MATKTLVRAILKPETGLFSVTVGAEGQGILRLELPPDEFMSMVKYLGQVATSYTEWLKSGGQLP